MLKKKNKIIGLFLMLVMSLGVLTFFGMKDNNTQEVYAAGTERVYEITDQRQLHQFMEYLEPGIIRKYVLQNDIFLTDYKDTSNLLVCRNEKAILDLNGHAIAGIQTSLFVTGRFRLEIVEGADLTIIDSQGGGSIDIGGGSYTDLTGIVNCGKLTIDFDKKNVYPSHIYRINNVNDLDVLGNCGSINEIINYNGSVKIETGATIREYLTFAGEPSNINYTPLKFRYSNLISKPYQATTFKAGRIENVKVSYANDVSGHLTGEEWEPTIKNALNSLNMTICTREYPAYMGATQLPENSNIMINYSDLHNSYTNYFDVVQQNIDNGGGRSRISRVISTKGAISIPKVSAPAEPNTEISYNKYSGVTLRTQYETQMLLKNFDNTLSFKWYRKYVGESDWRMIHERTATTYVPAGGGFRDPDAQEGKGEISYYCEFTSSTDYATKIFRSAIMVVPMKPQAPSSAKIKSDAGNSATASIKRTESVKLTASYGSAQDQNLEGTLAGAEYSWEIYDETTETWTTEGLKGFVNATFEFGGNNCTDKNVNKPIGEYKVRVQIRLKAKTGLISDETISAPFTVKVEEFPTPVVALKAGTNKEITKFESGNATMQVVCSNAEQYGNSVSYRWQYFNLDTNEWNDIYDGNSFGYAANRKFIPAGVTFNISGAETDTLSVTHSGNAFDKLMFRCKVVGRGQIGFGEEISVKFIELPKPEFTQNLLESYEFQTDVSGNSKGILTVKATGYEVAGSISFKWQKKNGANWEDLKTESFLPSQNDTSSLEIERTTTDTIGKWYRCVISNTKGEVISTETLVKIIDTFVLNVSVTNLSVNFEGGVGDIDYTIDNTNRVLTCYVGDYDSPFTMSFEYDITDEGTYDSYITKEYGIVPNWRTHTWSNAQKTGYSARVDISQAGTYTYEAKLVVTYENGSERQRREYNAQNTPGFSYTVIVLPKDKTDVNSGYYPVEDKEVVIGEQLNLGLISYSNLFKKSAGISKTNASQWRSIAIEDIAGREKLYDLNATMQSWGFVKNYQLFVELPNGRINEFKLIKTWGVESFADYETMNEILYTLASDQPDLFVTYEEYQNLLPEDFYGKANAYIVMTYLPIVEEYTSGDDQVTTTTQKRYQGDMFTIKFIEPCHHENYEIEISYTQDDVTNSCKLITFSKKCSVCGEYFDSEMAFLRTGEPIATIPQVNPTATQTGLQKHMKSPWEEKYFLWDDEQGEHGCWMEAEYEDLIIPLATTGYNPVAYLAPTCTTAGHYAHYVYGDGSDGNKYIEVEGEWLIFDPTIPASHTLDVVAYVEPDCTHTGTEQHYKCSVCDELFSDFTGNTKIQLADTVIDALGHNYEWVVDTQATLESAGEKHEECTRCHDIRNANTEIPMLTYTKDLSEDGLTYIITLNGDLAIGVDIKAILQDPALAGKNVAITVADKGTITFNADAVAQLLLGDVILTVKEGSLADYDGAKLVLIIKINEAGITFTGNAKATISYAFTEAVPSGKVAKVYYVLGENKEDMNATFADNKATFDTTHFSTYVVMFENESIAPSAGENSGLPTGALVGIIIGSIVVLLAGAYVCIYFFAYKKGKFNNKFTKAIYFWDKRKEEEIKQTENKEEK